MAITSRITIPKIHPNARFEDENEEENGRGTGEIMPVN
jgi:hypothetical protein